MDRFLWVTHCNLLCTVTDVSTGGEEEEEEGGEYTFIIHTSFDIVPPFLTWQQAKPNQEL